MRYASPTLVDVHHLGPKRERNISGVCSVCRLTLLVWLQDSEVPTPALADRLEQLFRKHVQECHTRVFPLPAVNAAKLPNQNRTCKLITDPPTSR